MYATPSPFESFFKDKPKIRVKYIPTAEDTLQTSILTKDFNPTTYRIDFAEKTIVKQLIAHGFNTVFQFPKILNDYLKGLNFSATKFKLTFKKPVYPGHEYWLEPDIVSLKGNKAVIVLQSFDTKNECVVAVNVTVKLSFIMFPEPAYTLAPQKTATYDEPLMPKSSIPFEDFKIGMLSSTPVTIDGDSPAIQHFINFEKVSTSTRLFTYKLIAMASFTQAWGMTEAGPGCLMAKINLTFDSELKDKKEWSSHTRVNDTRFENGHPKVTQLLTFKNSKNEEVATGEGIIRPITRKEREEIKPFLKEWGIL